MRDRSYLPQAGLGRTSAVAAVCLAIIIIVAGWKVLQDWGPSIVIQNPPQGLGQDTKLAVEARDAHHGLRELHIAISQNGRVLHEETFRPSGKSGRSWRFWSHPVSVLRGTAVLDRNSMPGLTESTATIDISATNDSWGRFFRGGKSSLALSLPARFTAPQIAVLTTQHYINQGGCDMVVFRVSPGVSESGVQVGQYFFPSFPVTRSMPDTRLAIFAYPWDLDPATPAKIVAHDDVGNQAVSTFNYRVFSKKFHTDTIKLDDAYIQRVIPPIMSETTDLADQGSPLKNFLEVNGSLRQRDADKLVELAKHTSPYFLWKQPFIRLPAKTEASFADYRTYTYQGRIVDHQTHLGFDLAGLEHMPVLAANDGVVVMAQFFGIYGEAVVIDHGAGLQTLYGHMSSIGVKPGQMVKRGEQIGVSGSTGLAGGDHLHFTVLLDGVPVNPTEWWDPHWIHDRIEFKLAALAVHPQ